VPPPGCPNWDYSNHPECSNRLPASSATLLVSIESGNRSLSTDLEDTRPIHKSLFAKLWPAGHAYYVGNYRGLETKKCLKFYDVFIENDDLVGTPADSVHKEITELGETIVRMADEMTAKFDADGTSPADRAVSTVQLACLAFVNFLTVHPFANGNGHVARAILIHVLRHFGFRLNRWTLDPRPQFGQLANYDDMIYKHRRGETAPLEQFVLSCISQPPQSAPSVSAAPTP